MLVLTVGHGRATLRQGVAPGRGRPRHAGPDRDAPVAAPEPARGAHRAAAAPGSRAVVAEAAPARRPRPQARSARNRLSAAMTVGGYRAGALMAKLTPGARRRGFRRRRSGSAPPAGPTASGGRWSSGTSGGSTRSGRLATAQRGPAGVRLVRPLLDRERPAAGAAGACGRRARMVLEVFDRARARRARGGQRGDPGPAAPRRLGVGRSVARRPGPPGDRRGRADRPARAVRVVRSGCAPSSA